MPKRILAMLVLACFAAVTSADDTVARIEAFVGAEMNRQHVPGSAVAVVRNGAPRHHHGGSWQGFRCYIARYTGADLTIIVQANLAEAVPARFVDGIARIIDPALAQPGVEEE